LIAPLMGVCRVIACVAEGCRYPVRRGGAVALRRSESTSRLTAPLMGVCPVLLSSIACVAEGCGYPVRRRGDVGKGQLAGITRDANERNPTSESSS
jgi:hypothetical protein